MPPSGNQYLNSRHPWIPEHGYVLSLHPDRLRQLEKALCCESVCSQAIPTIPVALRRRWMLCFISARKGYLTHVARSVAYYPAESGKDKLDIWNLTLLAKPVRLASIKSKVQGKQGWRAKRALDGGHASTSAFGLILEALARADAQAGDVAEGLINRSAPPSDALPTNARINWAYQRDAVVTALEIARIPKDQLKSAAQLDGSAPVELTSIFDSEDDVTLVEDLAILRDLDHTNEDWRFIRQQRYPAKTFTNGDATLTVILANKLPLETQLGVDLIYVNETLQSVVFVQYKMFAGTDGEEGYRPNAQLNKEIARMDTAAETLSACDADDSCDGYRFGTDPFFLKFCSKLLTHDAKGHVPGIYVPLTYWKRLAKTPKAKGRNGGAVVYADTFGRRHFTPTHFIDMVSRGWVGTSALQTDVLAPYLKAMIEGKKAVVLAVESLNVPDHAPEGDDDFPPESTRRSFVPPKPRYPGKKPKVVKL